MKTDNSRMSQYYVHMKTIAITIDEPTLKRLDQLTSDTEFSFRNRSDVIRRAVQQFLERLQREPEGDLEAEIFRRHKTRLNRQAAALIKEQARQ